MSNRLMVTVALVMSLGALQARAEDNTVYTWTDQDGVTHYSQSPPKGEAFETREVHVPPPARIDPSEKAAEEAKPENDLCLRVRANIKALEASQVVNMDLDGDGEPEILTAEQRETQLGIAQQQVSIYCK